jgi:hypothetical protein
VCALRSYSSAALTSGAPLSSIIHLALTCEVDTGKNLTECPLRLLGTFVVTGDLALVLQREKAVNSPPQKELQQHS